MNEQLTKPLLIAMVGLPRSGKSTITKELSTKLNAPIVNQDAIRLALHGKRYEGLAEPIVKAIAGVMIRSLFLSGHRTVICDETNYSRAARNTRRDDKLWDTRFYIVPTDPKTCKMRAVLTGQDDLLPVIDEMQARWEPLGPDEILYSVDGGLDECMANASSARVSAPASVTEYPA